MHAILLATVAGAPIAALLMSQPEAAERDCVFVVMARDSATYDSREGQVLLPDRPTEYTCRYVAGAKGTTVTLKNQNGWRISVDLDLDGDARGRWSAEKDGERLAGAAMAMGR